MKKISITPPLNLALGLALAGSAQAGMVDWTGSNIYMKFLDGDRYKIAHMHFAEYVPVAEADSD